MDASPLSSFPTPVPGDLSGPLVGGRLSRSFPQARHHVGDRPDRYFIQEENGARFLYCREAPEVKVRIEHGLTFTAAAAHKAAEGSIFLDGVAQGAPFIDAERRVFNLDHHADCVRQFTLSSCEQALVLVRRGLDLRERSWTLYANEPDLDTVLALWVLLNAMHVTDNAQVRDAITPLVRVEGTLDVHGRDRIDLAALPPPALEAALSHLDELHRSEQAARRGGSWEHADPLAFTAEQLRAIDGAVFPAEYFEGFRHVEALARAELSDHRIAVVCSSDRGIYEAEEDLKRLYGKRLGIVALQKEPHVYTLRQVDAFLPGNLEAAYARLNILDPAVRSGSGRNRWGGSAEIGGSPRRTGTRLSPQEIAEACRQAYRKPTWKERGWAAVSALLVALVCLAGGGPGFLARFVPSWSPLAVPAWRLAAGMSLVAVFFLVLLGRKRPRLYGLRLPGGWDWLWLTPLALLGAAAGGAWTAGTQGGFSLAALAVFLAFPLAAELIYRSLAHGILARSFHIMHDGGRWFVSVPTMVSAALYAAITPLPPVASALLGQPWGWLLALAGALLFGLAAGAARERSGSVLAPLLLHSSGALLAIFTAARLVSALR
jgi:membrane protease YdiL (CAAX protease family)